MLAAPTDQLPAGTGWVYEPKFDGWRLLAFRLADRVFLQSRTGKNLSTYFPEVTRVVKATVPVGTVLDGELIVWEPGRARTNFALLQRRITAGARVLQMARENPAHHVVFDLLADATGPLLRAPLSVRRARLEMLLADAPPQLALGLQTTDLALAREWLDTWTAAGIEGIVAKRLDGRYEPGRRGWRKLRARSTTEAIIGGVTGTVTDPDTLLLGRFDTMGRLRYTNPRLLHRTQEQTLGALSCPREHVAVHVILSGDLSASTFSWRVMRVDGVRSRSSWRSPNDLSVQMADSRST